MSAVVVQAHPVEDSYNAALLAALTEGMRVPTVIRICQGGRLRADDVAVATELIAVYPTWWGSVPAELLAALNDLIGPWVDGQAGPTSSPLRTVRSLTVVTTHGSSKFINRLQGEPGRQLWKRTILPLCAPDATFTWRALYGLDRAGHSDRVDFLSELAKPREG